MLLTDLNTSKYLILTFFEYNVNTNTFLVDIFGHTSKLKKQIYDKILHIIKIDFVFFSLAIIIV